MLSGLQLTAGLQNYPGNPSTLPRDDQARGPDLCSQTEHQYLINTLIMHKEHEMSVCDIASLNYILALTCQLVLPHGLGRTLRCCGNALRVLLEESSTSV